MTYNCIRLDKSGTDRKPLATCHVCAKKAEQLGGIWMGLRFLCRNCQARRLRK